MSENKDNSIRADVKYALISIGVFFLALFFATVVDSVLAVAPTYKLAGIAYAALKVFVASALSWGLLRLAFKKTLGRDFGSVFDNGWSKLSEEERARWIIGSFGIIFAVVAFLLP